MPELSFDQGTLLLEGISRHSLARRGGTTNWVWDGRVGRWRCDALHYATVRDQLHTAGFRLIDNVAAREEVRWPQVSLPELREGQEEHPCEAVNAFILAATGRMVE